MEPDPLDELRHSCQNHITYPENLVRYGGPRHKLKTLSTVLGALSGYPSATQAGFELFNREGRENGIDIVDLSDGHEERTSFFIEDHKQLQEHLESKLEDPKFRYVSVSPNTTALAVNEQISIEACSSRDPLACTRNMLTLFASYHQLQPAFLDAVFGFRSNHSYKPLDWSVAAFHFDDTFELPEDKVFQIPALGRSGREIRTTYLLRGVEPSQSIRGWNWGIRQLGLHHVFDVETGRALLVSVKGNRGFRDLVEESLQEDSSDPSSLLHPSNLCNSVESFPASMEFHRMAIDWCDANWRWYISDLEARLRQVIEEATTATINRIPLSETLPKDVKQTYMLPSVASGLVPAALEKGISRQTTLFSGLTGRSFTTTKVMSFGKGPIGGGNVQSLNNAFSATGFDHHENQRQTAPLANSKAANRRAEQQLVSLNLCTVRGQQELQFLSEKVQESLIVVRDNSAVIRRLKEDYLAVVKQPKFPHQLHSRAPESVAQFAKAVEGIEERMSRRAGQLEQLAILAQNGRSLFAAVQQQQIFQMTKIYSDHSNTITGHMRELASQTAKDTWAMQKITVVTLVFLPGTFIATFIQSGVFNWGDAEDTQVVPHFFLKTPALYFFIICVVILVVFIVTLLYCIGRKRERKGMPAVSDADSVV